MTADTSTQGQPAGACIQDASQQIDRQERLRLLEASIARLNDMVVITDAGLPRGPGPRIVFVNDAFERSTGYRRDDVIGKTPRILQGPKTQRGELARIGAALASQTPVQAEMINYTKDGKEFWVELNIAPVKNEAGSLTHWVAIAHDMTRARSAEQESYTLAYYDPLTLLPNRRLLWQRLQQTLAASSRSRHKGALMFIDLDNFKILNDTLGHDKGDLLLQQVAQRLSQCLRKQDTVARLGGDEFVVILEHLGTDPNKAAASALTVSEKILASLNLPFRLEGYEYMTTASIGVTNFDGGEDEAGELLKRADFAMYQAKSAGRNTMRFFDPDMQAVVTARAALEADMRKALRDREFVLHYQPQTNGEGRVIAVEALVRWRHARRGMISPLDFIPLAEETGLILPLGRWVLEEACRQLVLWSRCEETAHINMAVNVSARQFHHPDFVQQVLDVLEETGALPHMLKLELTESLLISDMDGTIAKMKTLKARGVGFSLDDFGMGYSSLSYLKRLPLDELKIDQAFIRDVVDDQNDAAIARTIVALGQSLGLDVIAEGVETEEQRLFLAQYGCGTCQGYLFTKPLAVDQFEEFLRQGLHGLKAQDPPA